MQNRADNIVILLFLVFWGYLTVGIGALFSLVRRQFAYM